MHGVVAYRRHVYVSSAAHLVKSFVSYLSFCVVVTTGASFPPFCLSTMRMCLMLVYRYVVEDEEKKRELIEIDGSSPDIPRNTNLAAAAAGSGGGSFPQSSALHGASHAAAPYNTRVSDFEVESALLQILGKLDAASSYSSGDFASLAKLENEVCEQFSVRQFTTLGHGPFLQFVASRDKVGSVFEFFFFLLGYIFICLVAFSIISSRNQRFTHVPTVICWRVVIYWYVIFGYECVYLSLLATPVFWSASFHVNLTWIFTHLEFNNTVSNGGQQIQRFQGSPRFFCGACTSMYGKSVM